MFHWGIEEALNLGKGYNLIELLSDLAPRHPKNRAVQIDVFSPGQFRVKAGADLKQAGNPPPDFDPASGGLGYAAEYFE